MRKIILLPLFTFLSGWLMAGVTITLSSTNLVCNGSASGSVSVTPTSGTTPFTYTWSNGSTTANVSNLAAGVYNVTVLDATSASASGSVTVNQPSALIATIFVPNVQCYGELTSLVEVTPSGGINPYSYHWSNNSTEQNLNNLTPGNYSVTVSDANGCSVVDSATIRTAPLLTATFTLVADTSQAHHWFLVYSENFTPSNYAWNWGDGSSSTGPNPSHTYTDSGYYHICMALSDTFGCTISYCDSSTYLRGQQQLIISVNAIAQTTTGINDISNSAVTNVYPNPAVNTLHIITSMQGIITYQLYNTFGQLLSQKEAFVNDADIDMQNLIPGIYIIKLKNSQREGLVKFIKE